MSQLVIADPHGLYRRGLRMALEESIPNLVVHAVETLDGARAALRDEKPVELAIIDLVTPGLHSLGDLREIRRTFPGTRFIVLSAQESSELVIAVLAAGLHGYIAKSQPESEIIAAVTDVLAGRIYVPPWLSQASGVAAEVMGDMGATTQAGLSRLTLRQQEVLTLVAGGLPNKEISDRLSISKATAKIHVAALMRALSDRNRTELAMLHSSSL